MNIIFFAHRIIYGGGEKVRNWLANQLIDHGHTVVYAIPTIDEQVTADLHKVGLLGRVKAIEYPFHIKKKKPCLYYKRILNIYQEHNIHLLIFFGGSLVEQLAARQLGVKILLSERCDPHSRSIPSQILKQIQYHVADGYVFQTPEASQCYGKHAHQIGTVIPNAILDKSPDPIFTNLRKEIVTVGRLSNEKNQLMLLKAFAIIHNQMPDFKLVFYGSGPLKNTLIKYANAHGIGNKISIISGKTNITELINGASLFVLSSNTEGMPNALIEAMSMGILSISTDCPIYGPRFLVSEGKNAFLTPPNDANLLADKILFALNHPDADKIRKEAVNIRKRLHPTQIFSQWLSYISQITNNKNS